ncbi:MAG: antiactivator of flagellar biosynthesis FleN protein [Proteobacteria bacterium]|nr:antiactivator of flagellar biosynthesis FleN protein [Pseudomonadota bacterium]
MNPYRHDVRHDQAEGLRRLFAPPQPRVITVLSNLPDADKDMLLVNLSVALDRTGNGVLLVDARSASGGIADRVGGPAQPSLAEAVRGNLALENVVSQTPQGCQLMTLTQRWGTLDAVSPASLAQAFENVIRNSIIVLIDGETAKDGAFPLPAMESGEIVLQLSSNQESVKSAYALLKRLNARLGRRPFSILVTGASEREAGIVSQNLIEAANRYLAVSLDFLGWVPADIHLDNASRMGKSVVNAFPLAGAAIAYRRIAENLVSV